MTPHRPLPSAVLFVADVSSVSRFYQGVAELRVVHEGDGHVVLETEGFQLVVHALRGEPQPHRDSNGRVLVREDSYWKLCLPVARIAAARERARELGGFVQPPTREWRARGFNACDGHDPEGNVIQLRESAD